MTLEGPSSALHRRVVSPAAAVALVYSAGFVVVNAHVGQYHLLSYSLLRIQYLGAGLLFAAITSFLAVAFSIGWRQVLKRTWRPSGTVDSVRAWASTVGSYLVVIAGAQAALFPIMVTASEFPLFMFTWGSLVYAALVCSTTALLLGWWHTRAQPHASTSSLLDYTALFVGALLFLAASYGQLVYPYLKPEFGGGVVWLVEPVTGAPDEHDRVGMSTMAVLEASDGYIRVLECARGASGPPVTAIQYRIEDLVPLRAVRRVAVPNFLKECRRGRT